MTTLTTRQRDILRVILEAKRPIGSVELSGMLNLTPRQVNYSLKGVRVWLRQRNQDLKVLPGVGFAIAIAPEQARAIQQEISGKGNVQIILSVSQRQQLLALYLLTTKEPFILMHLEQVTQVSRVTAMKDLDEIEAWLNGRQIDLVRKPGFGIQVSGAERQRQQALAEILWGETPFSSEPVVQISHADGLEFTLQRDAKLLPLVEYANTLISGIAIRRMIGLVAKAEEQLGGRFTDDAVLHLALVLAILGNRMQSGNHLEADAERQEWLQTTTLWPVAQFVIKRLGREAGAQPTPADTAWVAMQMMAAPRNEMLPGELEHIGDYTALIRRLLETISETMGISKMKHDRILEDGISNCIVPACFRQQFRLWFPQSLNVASLPEQYEREYAIAGQLAAMVNEHSGVTLPESELDNLAVLLRAAFIRNRSYHFRRVIVVCPSGMATAQLLVARLNARFPYLNALEVVSLRDLAPALVTSADLILTTVPLPRQFAGNPKVIQVHPLLMPEDIEIITQFLS